MSEKNLPKVLAISLSTWREDSGIHTQTDLFQFWDSQKVAQIYTKSDLPNTPVCNKFFRIAENEVIKSVFKRREVGKEVENGAGASQAEQAAIKQEAELYKMAHKRKSWFYTLMREFVWLFGCWKSKALDAFIEEFDPDVYFVPIYPVAYMGWLQRYILKKHPRPYVCYLADDNYSYMACGKNPLAYIHRFMLRRVVKKLAVNCDEMFTITKTEAVDTDNLFGTHSVVLTKGIDYSGLTFERREPQTPVKLVYTGNLVIGRHYSLAAIARALANINKDGIKATLDIYSPDTFDEQTMALFNSNGCHFHGRVPREEVYAIQEAADVVVFVESLEKAHRNAARLSFSTKLTDYFKSGKCIFAIGDKTIAPIEYLRENDAAVIANEYEEIEPRLRELLADPTAIPTYGEKAFECGRRNHERAVVKETFVSTLTRAADKGKNK